MGDVSQQPNRARRMALILERDGDACVWCGRRFDRLVRPTTEHVIPRLKGGPSWVENEVAACRTCNRERGHRGVAAWIRSCEARGWTPDRDLLVGRLEALEAAIAVRGGQRRARAALDAELRRLR